MFNLFSDSLNIKINLPTLDYFKLLIAVFKTYYFNLIYGIKFYYVCFKECRIL